MSGLVLHDYWRSGAAWRVRIALGLKGLDYTSVPHDLRTGQQRDPDYRAVAPQGLVPALETGSHIFTQSLAILEWLEERHPAPPLLPADADDRALVRAMTLTIACDIHPLNNLRVLNALRDDLAANKAQVLAWTARWIGDGLAALEQQVAQHGAGWCFGDVPTYADCILVPQLYSARRFSVDLSAFPTLLAVDAAAAAHPAFIAAHASNQTGAEG